jgi:putative salt-induced outer membrane protein YdiY
MPRLWIGLLLLGLCLPLPTSAQINTERMRALDVEGMRTTVGGDVAVQSGNVDLFEVGANTRVDYRIGRHYAFLAGEVRYGRQDDAPFRDRTFGHLRYNYRLVPRLVAEAFTQLERDGFARLQLRTLVGGGLRVQYLDTKAVKIFQGTTPMYEHENLEGDDLAHHPAATSTMRWSNYLNVRLRFTDTTHLITTVYVQPRLDAFEDVRVLQQATLAVDITEHVRLTAEFNLNYDSRPPTDVVDLDVALRNGLQVSF